MIVHEYFAVNLEIVRDTVHEDFPRVYSDLQKAYEALPDEDA